MMNGGQDKMSYFSLSQINYITGICLPLTCLSFILIFSFLLLALLFRAHFVNEKSVIDYMKHFNTTHPNSIGNMSIS